MLFQAFLMQKAKSACAMSVVWRGRQGPPEAEAGGRASV